jgi:hypothetical protein
VTVWAARLRVPVGEDAERWVTRVGCHRVLLIVHNVTSAICRPIRTVRETMAPRPRLEGVGELQPRARPFHGRDGLVQAHPREVRLPRVQVELTQAHADPALVVGVAAVGQRTKPHQRVVEAGARLGEVSLLGVSTADVVPAGPWHEAGPPTRRCPP